jgi:hypothetical protein
MHVLWGGSRGATGISATPASPTLSSLRTLDEELDDDEEEYLEYDDDELEARQLRRQDSRGVNASTPDAPVCVSFVGSGFLVLIVNRIFVPERLWKQLCSQLESSKPAYNPKWAMHPGRRRRGVYGLHMIPAYHWANVGWMAFMLLFDLTYTVRQQRGPTERYAKQTCMGCMDRMEATPHESSCMQAFWVPLSVGMCIGENNIHIEEPCAQANLFGGGKSTAVSWRRPPIHQIADSCPHIRPPQA